MRWAVTVEATPPLARNRITILAETRIYPSPASAAFSPDGNRGDARKASWDEWLAKSAAIIEESQRRRG